MSNTKDRPVAYAAQERAPWLKPAYLYIVQMEDGQSWFLTNRDHPVSVAGLPAEMGAADPQEFTPAQIKHSAVESKDRYQATATTITTVVGGNQLQRYFLTAAAVKLKAWILKGSHEGMAEILGPMLYGDNVITVQSGILGKVGFRGNTIAVEVTPEPFYVEGGVPRQYYNRECQHFLYGARFLGVGCGVNKEAFKFETTVAALDPAQRIMTLTGQKADTAATYFNRGHLLNVTLGGRMSIAWSAFNAGNTDLKLVTWHPEIETGQSIKAYAGCPHTVTGCRAFDNAASYGGFPDVPNRTPLAGVA